MYREELESYSFLQGHIKGCNYLIKHTHRFTYTQVETNKMTKGTTSMGQRHKRTHILCRRCGRNAYHVQWQRCAACAYPRSSRRRFNWSIKAIHRRKTGTGRCRYLKVVHRRIANHFKTPKA